MSDLTDKAPPRAGRGTRDGAGRAAAFVLLAVPLGLVAFFPLFGVLFTGNLDLTLIGLSLAADLVGGTVIGYFNPRWWAIAGLLAWPCGLESLYNLAVGLTDPVVASAAPLALLVLAVPLATALAGGYLGKLIAREHPRRTVS